MSTAFFGQLGVPVVLLLSLPSDDAKVVLDVLVSPLPIVAVLVSLPVPSLPVPSLVLCGSSPSVVELVLLVSPSAGGSPGHASSTNTHGNQARRTITNRERSSTPANTNHPWSRTGLAMTRITRPIGRREATRDRGIDRAAPCNVRRMARCDETRARPWALLAVLLGCGDEPGSGEADSGSAGSSSNASSD